MSNVTKHPQCPMRHENGNCLPIGGFCVNAVPETICEALHSAFTHGCIKTLCEVQNNLLLNRHLVRDVAGTATEGLYWKIIPTILAETVSDTLQENV